MCCSLFSFCCPTPHRALHSFPTRRSSDLGWAHMARPSSKSGLAGIMVGCRTPGSPRSIMISVPRSTCCEIACAISPRSEEHTSELQSHHDLVCRLLLEKKKKTIRIHHFQT